MNLTEAEAKQLEALTNPEDQVLNEYKWNEDYQRQILAMLLVDRWFLTQSVTLIKSNYFTNEAHKLICKKLFDFFEKYKTMPTKIIIRQELEDSLVDRDVKIKDHYINEFNVVLDHYISGLDTRDALLDKIANFSKVQALKNAFNESLDALKKAPDAEKTWTDIREKLKLALMVERNTDLGLDYFNTLEDRYDRMANAIQNGEVFTSGYEPIDNALAAGGPQRGEMYCFVGLSGTGKSRCLVATASENVKKDKKVLYVSLEMDQDSIATRFDSLFTNIGTRNLIDNRDDAIQILKDQVADKEDNKLLIVKRFAGGTMDVNLLRAYYSQLVLNGFKPDVVIIDYIGEMKDAPGIPVHESRYRIVRDLRGFAVEEQICVFSALQPNKSGREAQKTGFIDDENLADAFAQIRPLDGCWSLNQVQEEKDGGIARLFVIKHRNGKSRFVTWLKYDDETLRVSSITKETFMALAKKAAAEKQVRASDMAGYELEQYQENAKKQLKNKDYDVDEQKPKNDTVSMTGDDYETE